MIMPNRTCKSDDQHQEYYQKLPESEQMSSRGHWAVLAALIFTFV